MQGQIFKIFSDFYYVKTEDFGILECKLREIIKKRSEDVIVGDYVEIESLTADKKQAFISSVLPRKNFLTRPKVANITQAVIVSSVKNPDLDFEQLNRYIALCEYHGIKPVLCFNKNDLTDDEKLRNKIKNIYEPIGYTVFFTSALLKQGTEFVEKILKNNVSILCGASGVGKSSLINLLSNGKLQIETRAISDKTKRGVHTTRHCEIYQISENTSVVDTPGFSNAKFNFLMPYEVQNLFPEMRTEEKCKFADCLHLHEQGCKILENPDIIDETRYKSYVKFVEEAKEYKQKVTYNGTKTETLSKMNKGVQMTKISERKRALSRRVINQNISKDGENNV
ncbi:MAG: ribosome small subunit-dependent GTPase A [Candidatus Gastranaerophilales bacterium]|nr:ribosome small subunit-dependent GTPase A [Candidatus Gastranaerophilales bacterium]